MARSHIAVALGAALVASLIIAQLVINLGFPKVDFWHLRLDQPYHASQHAQTQFVSEKQSGAQADDPASYLLGVGKADITGYVHHLRTGKAVLMLC
jgi:neutral ceramidase